MTSVIVPLKIAIQQAGALIGNRKTLNIVSGATVADDAGNDRVNLTFTATGNATAALSTSDSLDAGTITTTETAFTTNFTIPANALVAGKVYRFTFILQVTSSGTAVSFTFRVRTRGTANVTVLGTSSITPSNGLTNRPVLMIAWLQGTAAAGASVAVEIGGTGPILPGAQVGGSVDTVASPQNIRTNEAQVVEATIQFGAGTAGNTVQLRQLIVEQLT